MSHPCDHSGLGSLLGGNQIRPGHRYAADRSGVPGDRVGELLGQIGIPGSEGKEREDAPAEVVDVLGLLPIPSGRLCGSPPRVDVRRAFCLQVGPDCGDAVCRSSAR